jgi:hypothetical protein
MDASYMERDMATPERERSAGYPVMPHAISPEFRDAASRLERQTSPPGQSTSACLRDEWLPLQHPRPLQLCGRREDNRALGGTTVPRYGHTESTMKPSLVLPLVLLAGAFAFHDADARIRNVTDPDAPRSLPEQGPVNVRWQDPAKFSEIRNSHNRSESMRGNWVEMLAQHVRKYATPRLSPGERLDIDITDIERAGDYEPWRGIEFQDTRFIREIYPPRISLSFTRTGPNGEVIAQGERKLVDHGFMMSSTTAGMNSDPLRYEKAMLQQWLARELPKPPQR